MLPLQDPDGLLPEGVHCATLDQVKERFGSFVESDRRPNLFTALETYLAEVRSTEFVKEVILDGSFVTSKPKPNDIDLILVLEKAHDMESDLRPFEYNVVSRKRVQQRHKFDLLVAHEGSETLQQYVEFFAQVRDRPGLRKGLVRVAV